ncbi:hypothetical protein EVAR_30600_1 [Eumeta japonica]|uniref:Uncharacterized protein n=1 Tax=Eumeta variegata TaxID=151549 RepID=A0A4C1WAH1_EUMVA|nr:hypothetical protein EVAR_30600_1 [Eumeta japonica]
MTERDKSRYTEGSGSFVLLTFITPLQKRPGMSLYGPRGVGGRSDPQLSRTPNAGDQQLDAASERDAEL